MRKSVSVIIPCYNAARWIGEAVHSCLTQTYQPVEIIVVDDGSTDESLEILQGFDQKIRLEIGPRRGGNHARNLGFALSRGEYIQFLDADDFLLSEKIAYQVAFLEEMGADVVYGDWRHQNEMLEGTPTLGPIQFPGDQEDIIAALLSGWWTANLSILFRRSAVIAAGGWDETLQVGQDRDFFLSVALTGADIRYQPGCYSIYRRYGDVTVSTSSRQRWLDNHEKILQKAERLLKDSGQWTPYYRQALAHSYFHVARNYYDRDKTKQQHLYQKVVQLDPHYSPQESRLYNTAYRLMGFQHAEKLAGALRQIRKQRVHIAHEASDR
ncbi:MAG: glycosyltransferase [Ardenticatenaceae bacterium]|nr:glycosyltransferase [Ardenticatenaceae bacterium]